ncbi:DNA-binding transcriptional LysR family regulator [Lysobacter niabensis]|uniref:DNA-binding transcriptional LysR family regulator n=1 Tax=Agrilutibacter niabensis TaxID=380628 RepID=A0ABU1VLZ4_9GAMM|nr:LysR family transcriptional regulator [Lysobacter niabensis]MDR7098501.1 DNA-binding transcriptional LysR family regulator [Lysobacter niabensis]
MTALTAAVEAGSLSAAARSLGVPLATMSRKVAELEKHLGTQVLLRGSRKLSLTEAGAGYVAACRRILEDIAEAERVVSGEYAAPTGELVVSVSHVFGRTHVLPIVCDFLRAFPDIRVRFQQTDYSVNLVEEQVDVAARLGAPKDGGLVAVPVGHVRRTMCASSEYLALHGVPRSITDLADHHCIVLESLGSTGRWDFAHGWLDYDGPVRSRIAVNTAEASLGAALQGLGIGYLLSYQTKDAIASGRLQYVLDEFRSAPSPVNLMYAPRKPLPLKIRAFIDFAAPRLRTLLTD